MSKKPQKERSFFLPKEGVLKSISSFEGQEVRSQSLIRSFYLEEPHHGVTPESLIFLFELVLNSRAILALFENITKNETKVVKEEIGFKVSAKDITTLAAYASTSKSIRQDLLDHGLLLDLQ